MAAITSMGARIIWWVSDDGPYDERNDVGHGSMGLLWVLVIVVLVLSAATLIKYLFSKGKR